MTVSFSYKFTNQATTVLPGQVNTTQTTINVWPGDGIKFPALSGGDFFVIALEDTNGNIEYCKCTQVSGDVLTVVRGYENTTPRVFGALARLELRLTAEPLNGVRTNFQDLQTQATSATTIANQASTKADQAVSTANAANTTALAAMPKTGGVFTGAITLAGNATQPLQPVTKQQLDSLDATATNAVSKSADSEDKNLITVSLATLPGLKIKAASGQTRNLLEGLDNTGAIKFSFSANADHVLGGSMAIRVPNGTVAQRPTGLAGHLRFNTETGKFEGYTDRWGDIGGGGAVTVSLTPPVAPTPGALWWHSGEGRLYVWYEDGSSNQWVPANVPQAAPPPPKIQGQVPFGGIIDFSGDPAGLPNEWALCDGGTYPKSDGSGNVTTPDLRGSFILGASPSLAQGATGGVVDNTTATSDTQGAHTHTINAAGAHNHTTDTQGWHTHGDRTGASDRALATDTQGYHSHGGGTGSTTLSVAQMPSHGHSYNMLSGTLQSSQNPSLTAATGQRQQSTGATTGSQGGDQGHTHTIGGDGGHAHNVTDHLHIMYGDGNHTHNISSVADHTHTETSAGGHSHSVTLRYPKYYVLAKIMRI